MLGGDWQAAYKNTRQPLPNAPTCQVNQECAALVQNEIGYSANDLTTNQYAQADYQACIQQGAATYRARINNCLGL
jgi:hypothetical protein